MFGKLNRKKPTAAPRKIIPDSMSKGETGAFLRKVGFDFNGAENLMPTQNNYQRKLDDLRQKEEVFIAKINSQLGDNMKVSPWAMIPFPCWTEGSHASFIYSVLDLFPYGAWNLLLLPDTDMSAAILGMDKNPKTASQQQIEICNKFIGQARASVMAAKSDTEAGMARLDMDALDGFSAAREKAQIALQTLAFQLGKTIIGEESFVKSRQMFFGDGELAKLA